MKYHRITILLSLAILVAPAFAANKCVGEDGKISFQDTPCPSTARSKEEVKLRSEGNTFSGAGAYGVGTLDLSGPPSQRAARVQSAFEALASVSTDCRIKLDVYGSSPEALSVCSSFTAHYKAWWTPANESLKTLLKDNEWARANIEVVEKSTAAMQKANGNAEYILRRLQTQRQSRQ